MHALIAAMGGDSAAVSRLDQFFTQLNAGRISPHEWAGNEPGFGTPWAYDYAGAPYKTQNTVRQIVNTLWSPTPAGEPGNDDLGSLSSWYVWAALGLYPETPGAPMLVVGSPLFPLLPWPFQTVTSLTLTVPGPPPAHPTSRACRSTAIRLNRRGCLPAICSAEVILRSISLLAASQTRVGVRTRPIHRPRIRMVKHRSSRPRSQLGHRCSWREHHRESLCSKRHGLAGDCNRAAFGPGRSLGSPDKRVVLSAGGWPGKHGRSPSVLGQTLRRAITRFLFLFQ